LAGGGHAVGDFVGGRRGVDVGMGQGAPPGLILREFRAQAEGEARGGGGSFGGGLVRRNNNLVDVMTGG
jgi:hypothetical protein